MQKSILIQLREAGSDAPFLFYVGKLVTELVHAGILTGVQGGQIDEYIKQVHVENDKKEDNARLQGGKEKNKLV